MGKGYFMRSVFFNQLLSVLIIILISSCASSPRLATYPSEEINRPYTLPDGISSWRSRLSVDYEKDDLSPSTTTADVIFLNWTQALTDSWTLLWGPLPLGVSHQFWNTPESRAGFTASLGFSHSSFYGDKIYPAMSFSYRHKLNTSVAIDFTSYFTPTLSFQSGEKYRWSAGISAGPIFQIQKDFSLKPEVRWGARLGKPTLHTAIYYASNVYGDEITWATDLGIKAQWSLNPSWDIKAGYFYIGIGEKFGYQDHNLQLEFINYW